MSERDDTGRRPGASRNALVVEHLWLAEALAREFAWLAPKTIDGDVSQPAYEGLVKAGEGYDPGAGAFVPYARKWILGAIFRAVDSKTPGFARRYGPVADLFGELEEEGSDEGAGEALDHAALAMCVGSESLRRAHGEPSGLRRALDDELARVPAEHRAVFLGRFVDGTTWEEIAAGAGISLSTAKRWADEVKAALVQRLKGTKQRG